MPTVLTLIVLLLGGAFNSWMGPLCWCVDAFGIMNNRHNSASPSLSSMLSTTAIPMSMDRRKLLRQHIAAGFGALLLIDATGRTQVASAVPDNALDGFLSDLASSSSSSSSPLSLPTTTKTPSTEPPPPLVSGSVVGKWPDRPSPLPTAVRSAAELTAIPEPMTDLEQALIDAAAANTRNRSDPRSHGY